MSTGYYDSFKDNAINDSPADGWSLWNPSSPNPQPTVVSQTGETDSRSYRAVLETNGTTWDDVAQAERVFFAMRVQRSLSSGYVQFGFGANTETGDKLRVRISFDGIAVIGPAGTIAENYTRGVPPVGSWFYMFGLLDRITGETKAAWSTGLEVPTWDIDTIDPDAPQLSAGYVSHLAGQGGLKYLDWIFVATGDTGEDLSLGGDTDENGQVVIVTGPFIRGLTVSIPGCQPVVLNLLPGSASAGTATGTGETDENGEAELTSIDTGKHTITITPPGCNPVTYETEIL